MTDKPEIAILMAVYEPRIDWLEQQLRSLDAQTYPNLTLYIQDDASASVPFDAIQACVRDCIHSFPCILGRNPRNLGSNRTFEWLTQMAQGFYFAYCDQDDIWMPEKLEKLAALLENTGSVLVCSDVRVIDGEGRMTASCMRRARRHYRPFQGEGLARQLLVRNWITGCTMLLSAHLAKQAVPFCPYMVHDHYLGLFCAALGRLEYCGEPLISYRVHGGNQTGILRGVDSKQSYLSVRVRPLVERLRWLQHHFPFPEALEPDLGQAMQWADAREAYLSSRRGGWAVWSLRRFGRAVTLFELAVPALPDRLFFWLVQQIQKNCL